MQRIYGFKNNKTLIKNQNVKKTIMTKEQQERKTKTENKKECKNQE